MLHLNYHKKVMYIGYFILKKKCFMLKFIMIMNFVLNRINDSDLTNKKSYK